MKKLLVPVDFSEASDFAVDYALQVAQIRKPHEMVQVEVMHSIVTAFNWRGVGKENEGLYPELMRKIRDAHQKLDKLVARFEEHDISASSSVAYSVEHLELEEHIRQRPHDLVIMGSYGARGYKERYLGSNAQRLVRVAPKPVVIVKQPVKHPIKRIVFTSHYDSRGLDAFGQALDFAHAIHAKVDALFVNTPYDFQSTPDTDALHDELRRRFIKDKDRFTFTVFNHADIEAGIIAYLERSQSAGGSDILSLVNYPKSAVVKFFTGSRSDDLINHLDLPILSLRLNEDKR